LDIITTLEESGMLAAQVFSFVITGFRVVVHRNLVLLLRFWLLSQASCINMSQILSKIEERNGRKFCMYSTS
jgi:hypothetical protein